MDCQAFNKTFFSKKTPLKCHLKRRNNTDCNVFFISFADNTGKPRKDRPQVAQIGNLGEALGFPYFYFVDYRIIQWKKYFLCYQFL